MPESDGSYETRLIEGVAQRLALLGLGSYRGDGSPYLDSEVPITLGRQHASAPVCLTLVNYDVQRRVDLPVVGRTYMQVIVRHASYTGGLDLLGELEKSLHAKTHVDLGQVRASEVALENTAYLGPSGNSGFEWTQNYRITGPRPSNS